MLSVLYILKTFVFLGTILVLHCQKQIQNIYLQFSKLPVFLLFLNLCWARGTNTNTCSIFWTGQSWPWYWPDCNKLRNTLTSKNVSYARRGRYRVLKRDEKVLNAVLLNWRNYILMCRCSKLREISVRILHFFITWRMQATSMLKRAHLKWLNSLTLSKWQRNAVMHINDLFSAVCFKTKMIKAQNNSNCLHRVARFCQDYCTVTRKY